MTTSSVVLTEAWVQITNGTQDYVVQLNDVLGDNSALMTLKDTAPAADNPAFTLKEGEGFSSITHPGKLWAKVKRGDQVILVVTK